LTLKVETVRLSHASQTVSFWRWKGEAMDRQNPYHPSGKATADGIKAKTNELVEYVMRATGAGGPKARRAAELASEKYREAAHWAMAAFEAEDFVAGDDGGGRLPGDEFVGRAAKASAPGPDRALAKEISDARDEDPPTLEP